MNRKQPRLDPIVRMSDGKRCIKIELDGKTERIIINALMKRAPRLPSR